eukprot:EG_transcript_8846
MASPSKAAGKQRRTSKPDTNAVLETIHQSIVPFNKPSIEGRELEYVSQCIQAGWISGDGPYTKKCQELLSQVLGFPNVMLTTNCTHALEMCAVLLNIQPGDEVICPSFTFVSTINAFALRGGVPVFVDCRPDTLNMDETLLERAITPRTKVIIPVHYGGVGCEMDAIMEIADRHGIPVVEDNAHGIFGKYKGRWLGTFGHFATQSFHETKNFSCGEGGALIVNDPDYEERAEFIREKGTNRTNFLRGQVSKYGWVDVGSSWLPSDMLAAHFYGQLEVYEKIQNKRKVAWDHYFEHLGGWAAEHGVQLPTIPAYCEQSYHNFYMLLPTAALRESLRQHLKSHRIMANSHYEPLHTSEMGMKFGYKPGDLPVTEDIAARLLRLPLFNTITTEELRLVTAAVKAFSWGCSTGPDPTTVHEAVRR